MGLKHILKKLILGPKTSSSDYVAYLRSLGMTIGDNTVIYRPITASLTRRDLG